MSGYVPKHHRKKQEPTEVAAPDESLAQKRPESSSLGGLEESVSTPEESYPAEESYAAEESYTSGESYPAEESNIPSEGKLGLSLPSLTGEAGATGATEKLVGAHDDDLLNVIIDADLAVRDNPSLANPLIVQSEISAEQAEASLTKIRRRRWPVAIAILLVLIISTGAIAFYVLSSQANEREENRAAGYKMLDEAIALIQDSDQIVIALDSATSTEVTEANIPDRRALLELVPATLERLSAAEMMAGEAGQLMVTKEDKEFVQNVVAAASNRRDMLTSGEKIISRDIEAMNSAVIFGQAWVLIVKADTALRETTQLSVSANYYELQQAIELNGAILVDLAQASELLVQASEAFPDADFGPVMEYVTLKTESIHIAIEADQAVLDGDAELAHSKNAEFALKDAAVVDAANRIPSNPLSLITSAYERLTADSRALYSSARANAAAADELIRGYVGVETQTDVQ